MCIINNCALLALINIFTRVIEAIICSMVFKNGVEYDLGGTLSLNVSMIFGHEIRPLNTLLAKIK